MVKFLKSELEELERALSAGEDVKAPEFERPRWTRLHHAVADGDLARVKLLLRFGADVDAQDAYGCSPIHMASHSDYRMCGDEETRVEIVELLLAAGPGLNARSDSGDTALSLAYHWSHACIVRALIGAGADPSISGWQGAPTPTFVVDVMRSPNGAEVVANMLAAGVDVNAARAGDDHTLLDRAAFCGSPTAVRALLDAGAEAGAKTSCPPLCSAAILIKKDGGEEAVVALVMAGADVDMQSSFNQESSLHHATRYRSLVATRLLLGSGAHPNPLDCHGQTPLCHAVRHARDDDDHDIIKVLLLGGADANGREGAISRPLHAASERGHASTVRLLLEAGADPHPRVYDGETALHAAARARACTATITVLLEAGADPNARNKNGDTPLHIALQCLQSPTAIRLLLDRGADLRIHGSNGCTTLHYALKDRDCTATVLSALLGAGADPNARDQTGATSLHRAVEWHSPSVTQLLLESGADPRACNSSGHTPLFCATLAVEHNTQWSEHITMLCDAGANINDPDADGVRPLYYALSKKAVETACSLLKLGANPYAGDRIFPLSSCVVIGLIGKASAHVILAIVTQGHLRSDEVDSERGRFVSCPQSYVFIFTYIL
ncbi:hypothetical protein BOTBODRAFT_611669 [Botryobasidium botryosum FD-172 SS1]|uniref:Uncharacterized protein n=1 Tax=Botryobasidium botryosum (strain FD-172 SS1) TaxID=930990 RepID=A0A067LYE9_BOTB1|nr:hypothetical protein BOTBODRAFT_611669 [Botryobasidium botryosum FD-172 SS1]